MQDTLLTLQKTAVKKFNGDSCNNFPLQVLNSVLNTFKNLLIRDWHYY